MKAFKRPAPFKQLTREQKQTIVIVLALIACALLMIVGMIAFVMKMI